MKGNKLEQCFNGIKIKWENLSHSHWYAPTDHNHHLNTSPVLLFMHKSINSNTSTNAGTEFQYFGQFYCNCMVLQEAEDVAFNNLKAYMRSKMRMREGHLTGVIWWGRSELIKNKWGKGDKLGNNKRHKPALWTVFSQEEARMKTHYSTAAFT